MWGPSNRQLPGLVNLIRHNPKTLHDFRFDPHNNNISIMAVASLMMILYFGIIRRKWRSQGRLFDETPAESVERGEGCAPWSRSIIYTCGVPRSDIWQPPIPFNWLVTVNRSGHCLYWAEFNFSFYFCRLLEILGRGWGAPSLNSPDTFLCQSDPRTACFCNRRTLYVATLRCSRTFFRLRRGLMRDGLSAAPHGLAFQMWLMPRTSHICHHSSFGCPW